MKLIRTYGDTGEAAEAVLRQIERRGAANTAKVDGIVREIVQSVRAIGDEALLAYAKRFDHLSPDCTELRVTREEMQSAWEATAPELREAMQLAQSNIRSFAEAQKPKEWQREVAAGVVTGQIVRPLDSVGCYVPGGRYPLPSTLLMTATPAQVAGVRRIVVCSPNPARETLAAAWIAGISEFYKVGGAQAVAAMAYGTKTVGRVEKIVGPGNLYVTAAKLMVSEDCGIDMPAGPTEIGVASVNGNAQGIAADLVAQAEHDPEALAVLITPNEALGQHVLAQVEAQSRSNAIAQKSLSAHGFVFVTESATEMRTLTNRLAFEHLTVDSMEDLAWIENAGSVFVGDFSPQSMGDYVSGPNHVLPTGRAGRFRGGLSVADYVKVITVQHYTREGLALFGPHAIALAQAEGLTAHAASVHMRLYAEGRG